MKFNNDDSNAFFALLKKALILIGRPPENTIYISAIVSRIFITVLSRVISGNSLKCFKTAPNATRSKASGILNILKKCAENSPKRIKKAIINRDKITISMPLTIYIHYLNIVLDFC